jgi:hypothetical protein
MFPLALCFLKVRRFVGKTCSATLHVCEEDKEGGAVVSPPCVTESNGRQNAYYKLKFLIFFFCAKQTLNYSAKYYKILRKIVLFKVNNFS